MKKVLIVLVAALLCGATFADEKPLQHVNERIAPPSHRTLDGQWCSTNTPLALPDGNSAGINDDLVITENETIDSLTVDLQVEHTWVGDIIASLSNGSCTIQLVHRLGTDLSSFGCSGDDIDITLDDAAAGSIEDACGSGPSGGAQGDFTPGDPTPNGLWPTAMADCVGETTAGTWTLNISDNATLDTGTLLNWCMNTTGTPTSGDGGGTVPATSTTGLIILAVLLMIGGSLFVMRRRKA